MRGSKTTKKPESRKAKTITDNQKIYLNVPFAEKDIAKKLGAKWDADNRKWYYTNVNDADIFANWAIKSYLTYDDLSDEQKAMINKVKGGNNVLVDACIGSGKTTAIQVLCNELKDKRILYLTYNKRVCEKISQAHLIIFSTPPSLPFEKPTQLFYYAGWAFYLPFDSHKMIKIESNERYGYV